MMNNVVDLNQDASTNLASNSTMLTAPVDPVPVLNPSVEENMEAPTKCNHFNIRGYVLEVRKRDPSLCYPFTQQPSTNLTNELPPMEIPERWCQCFDSIAEAAKDDLQKDSHETSHDEAQNIKSADDPTLLFGYSLKDNIAAIIQNYEANSTHSNDIGCQQVADINPDRKGKGKAHIEDELPLTSDARAQQILPQTTSSIFFEDNIDLNLSADNEDVYNGNGTPEAVYKSYTVDRGEAGSSKGYGDPEKDPTAENHQGVPQTSLGNNQGADPPANSEVAAIVGIAGPRNYNKGLNLPDLNEGSGEPSLKEIRETIVTETPINDEPSLKEIRETIVTETPIISFCNGEPSSEEIRETIVTEPLINNFCNGEPSKEIREPIVTEAPIDSFCNGEPSVEEIRETIVTETPINKDETVSLRAERQEKPKVKFLSDLLGLKKGQGSSKGRKKKTPSSASSKDEDVKRKRSKVPDEGSNSLVIRDSNEASKKTVGTSNLSESKGESDSDDVSIEIISEAVAKRRCKAFRDPLPEKRTVKKTKIDNGDSASLSQEITKRRSQRGKGKATEEPAPKRDISYQLRARKSVPTEKRSDNSKARKEPCKKKRIQDNGEAEQSAAGNAQKAAEDAHLAAVLADGNTTEIEKANAAASLALRTPPVGRPSITGNQSNGKISSGPISVGVPAAEGRRHLAQSMPMQVTNVAPQREHANEVRRLIHGVDINNIPIHDKSSKHGMGDDDIPMDIVEMMAKNQYERHRDDLKAKNASHYPSSGTYGRHNGASSSYAPPAPPSMQNPFLSMQNPPSTYPGSFMYEGNMGRFNPTGVHGVPQGGLAAAGLLTPSQVQDLRHPYSVHEIAVASWNANNYRSPSSFLQAVDQYQKERATAPRHIVAEAPRFWTSRITSRMSAGITNPHKMPGIAAPSIPLTLGGGINMEGQSSRPPVAPRDKGKAVAKDVSKASSKSTSPAPDNMTCHLNQNPSEFNDPQLTSQFVVGPEELKPTKKGRDKASGSRGYARKPAAGASKPKPSGTGRGKKRS